MYNGNNFRLNPFMMISNTLMHVKLITHFSYRKNFHKYFKNKIFETVSDKVFSQKDF